MDSLAQTFSIVSLCIGLSLLGLGYILKNFGKAPLLRAVGWLIFACYWSTQINSLYFSEGRDVFNTALCILGIFVLAYLSYREMFLLFIGKKEDVLVWLAGTAFISGTIYFTLYSVSFLRNYMILSVAELTTRILRFFGFLVYRESNVIYCEYGCMPISIIFACTAIQAMSLFIGMIASLEGVKAKRKFLSLILTITVIWLSNLIRTSGVVYLINMMGVSFFLAHNVISKIGGLVVLVALLLINFKFLPPLYNNVCSVFNIYKEYGPLENMVKKILERKV